MLFRGFVVLNHVWESLHSLYCPSRIPQPCCVSHTNLNASLLTSSHQPLGRINDATSASQKLPRPLSLSPRKLPSFLPSVVSILPFDQHQTNTWERGSAVLPSLHLPDPLRTRLTPITHPLGRQESRLLAPRAARLLPTGSNLYLVPLMTTPTPFSHNYQIDKLPSSQSTLIPFPTLNHVRAHRSQRSRVLPSTHLRHILR